MNKMSIFIYFILLFFYLSFTYFFLYFLFIFFIICFDKTQVYFTLLQIILIIYAWYEKGPDLFAEYFGLRYNAIWS